MYSREEVPACSYRPSCRVTGNRPAVSSAKNLCVGGGPLVKRIGALLHSSRAPKPLCYRGCSCRGSWGAGRAVCQDLPCLSLKLLPQPMPCLAADLGTKSLVANFLPFKYCIFSDILPGCWMLCLVLLAAVFRYHQLNSSCVTLKKGWLQHLHICNFF